MMIWPFVETVVLMTGKIMAYQGRVNGSQHAHQPSYLWICIWERFTRFVALLDCTLEIEPGIRIRNYGDTDNFPSVSTKLVEFL